MNMMVDKSTVRETAEIIKKLDVLFEDCIKN
jgi:hypothetical protein